MAAKQKTNHPSEVFQFPSSNSTTSSKVRLDEKMHLVVLGCLFRGDVGPNDVLPPGLGSFADTAGSGGSTTSDSVSTGYGASAGGKLDITCKRVPGTTGLMYAGRLSPRHRFLL